MYQSRSWAHSDSSCRKLFQASLLWTEGTWKAPKLIHNWQVISQNKPCPRVAPHKNWKLLGHVVRGCLSLEQPMSLFAVAHLNLLTIGSCPNAVNTTSQTFIQVIEHKRRPVIHLQMLLKNSGQKGSSSPERTAKRKNQGCVCVFISKGWLVANNCESSKTQPSTHSTRRPWRGR